MDLKSLLLCSDEKIVRVLRRTLGDLEIAVEHCTNSESALRFLTRERFEAIIVDCAGPGAAAVLRSARMAPCNKRAVAVAILDYGIGLRSAFELGAHFILYKPVSVERAKSSFRAARALMKKERRRNSRIPVQIPVEMSSRESGARFKVEHRHRFRRRRAGAQLATAGASPHGQVATDVYAAGVNHRARKLMRNSPGAAAARRWVCVSRIISPEASACAA